ncbi:MAG: bifunctional diguanylate cyclase/phosphodiesterase [Pseudomonadota bacterium]
MARTIEICVFLSNTDLSARLGQLAAVQGWTIIHWDTRPTPDLTLSFGPRNPDIVFFDDPGLYQTLQALEQETSPLFVNLHTSSEPQLTEPQILSLAAQSTDTELVTQITTALNLNRFSQQFFSTQAQEPITKLPHHPELLEYMDRHHGEPTGLIVVQIDHAEHLYANLDPVSKTDLLSELSHYFSDQLPERALMGIFDAACFVIWIPGTQPSVIRDIASKYCELGSNPIDFRSGELHFTLSAGYGFEAALTSPQNLWHDTWVAKEKARNEGGNQAVGVNDAAQVGARIPTAFERDEFSLVLQPQWNAAGDELRGVESLLRWQGMEVGNLAPDHFIPIAERSGQMARVGDWVLERAACESTTWLEHLVSPILLGINVSPQQFYNDAIKYQVERLAKDQWLDPSILELELSHNNLLEIVDQHRTTLYQLRDAGVRVAIDNLGTSVVDTQKLLRCPADTLKLDRSLVAQVTKDANTARLIEQICQLGAKFQLRVVAVGVETEEQRVMLESLGCSDMQGYLLAEPVPLDEFHQFLAKHHAELKAS